MISTIVTSVLLASANTAGVIAFSIPQTPSTPTTTTTTRTAFTRSTTASPINGIDDHVTGKLYKTSHSRLPMSSSTSSSSSDKELDTSAVIKYLTSAGVEITALAGFLYALDYGITTLDLSVPTWGIAALFYVLSLRSRVFNPLNNQRPDLSKMTKSDGTANDGGARGFGDRIMPSWTPPGVFFPILWILINAPLRAYSTALVYGANGHVLCDATILCFAWHLTCGDVWNTINNTERRIGASVAGVFCVWCSVVYATSRYWAVDDLAGKLLGLTALWITVAGALVTDTWRLNPGEDGELDPLYPVKGDAETKFLFEK